MNTLRNRYRIRTEKVGTTKFGRPSAAFPIQTFILTIC